MSDNPFNDPPKQPPVEASPYAPPTPASAQSLPPTAPGALTPILVFCLIFGIFGLLGNCMGGGALLLMPMMETMLDEIPNVPEEQKVFNKLNIGAQKSAMLPTLVLLAVNFVVATMLIIGSIGCFKRKESSRNFLRLAMLAAIFYSIIKIAATVYAYVAANAALKESIEKLVNDPIYDGVKSQFTSSQVVTIVSVVFGVFFSAALLGFYVWSRGYLGKPEVEEHFAAVERYKSQA